MGMEPGGIVAIGLKGCDHAGKSAAIRGAILEKLLDWHVLS